MVRVTEHKGGLTDSAFYYFIIDGNKLFHISNYATSIEDKRVYVEYEVDLSRLNGKNNIVILTSNSGIDCEAWEYSALDWYYKSKRITKRPFSYLNNFEFEYLTTDEKNSFKKTGSSIISL